MILCAITGGQQLPDNDPHSAAQRLAMLAQVAEWAAAGVDWIQIREKTLDQTSLLRLTEAVVAAVRAGRSRTRVSLNGPAALAQQAGADGVHVPGAPVPGAVDAIRRAFPGLAVSLACHSADEAREAAQQRPDLILFAPVFEKPLGTEPALAGQGLAALTAACRAAGQVPVLALGGVTTQNATQCIATGAAGVAGIRLFAGTEWRRLLPQQPER